MGRCESQTMILSNAASFTHFNFTQITFGLDEHPSPQKNQYLKSLLLCRYAAFKLMQPSAQPPLTAGPQIEDSASRLLGLYLKIQYR